MNVRTKINLKNLNILFKFWKEKKFLILFTFVLFIINSLVSIISPVFLGKLIDVFNKNTEINFNLIFKYGREFIILFCILTIVQIISGIFLANIKKESGIFYQNLILNKILSLPYLKMIKYRTAYLQNRWSQDSLNISSFFGDNLFELIKNVFIIVFGVIVAFWISPKFSFVLFFSVIIMGTVMAFISKYLINQLKKYLEYFSNLSGKVNETISGIIELKIMGFLKSFKKVLKNDIRKTTKKYYLINVKALIIYSFISLLIFAGFFGILIYFGYLMKSQKMTIGSAIGYVAITFFIIKSLTNLINSLNKLNSTFASLKRTSELINLPEARVKLQTSLFKNNMIENIDNIELKNIYFKYENKKGHIIKDFSYRFERGRVYGLSGKSGIGKSTLIKIMMGIIPTEKGEVLINGNVINAGNIRFFWEKIGYLAQDPFIFKGKLLDNLVHNNHINSKKINDVFNNSGLDANSFPIDMEIEEGGKNLSGGEKRRISLARVFLKDPDVLILDEPTSQIDRKTESIITNSIISFAKKGKISILIAHNPLTLKKVDNVIDLERYKSLN